MSVSKQIKFFRTESHLTQKKLSELTGIAEITIRQYEAGKYNPKIGNLQKMADVFNVPLKALLEMEQGDKQLNVLSKIPSSTVHENNGQLEFDLSSIDELYTYFTLNRKGKKKVLSYIEDLSKLPEYTE